jgi:hypothetical protein
MKKRYIAGGVVAAVIAVGVATSGGGEGGDSKSTAKPETSASVAADAKTGEAAKKETAEDVAVFKVWGTAANGASITYGRDGTNLQGKGVPMEKELKVEDDALYYQITAQLQGGGDIQCSVTVNGKTKTGRAEGGYNICSAQVNGGLTGW